MAKRRIKDAKITLLSLCKRGMNKMPTVFKSNGMSEFRPLVKEAPNFAERGELLAVVYAPNHEDYEGDVADAEGIRKMQRTSSKDGFQVDIHHDGKPLSKDKVFVTENFLIAKGDERFTDLKDYDDKPVNLTGGWGVVLKVDDPELRKKYRDGEWDGVSMFGTASVEDLTQKSDGVEGFLRLFREHFEPRTEPATEDDEMTPEELKKALEANNEASAKALVTALTAAGVVKAKPKSGDGDPPKKPEIKFEGDAMNPEDVAKHRDKLAVAKLQKDVDWNDPSSVVKYETDLATFQKAKKDAEDAAKKNSKPDPNASEIKKLQEQIAKLQGQSNQPGTEDGGGAAADPTIVYPEGTTAEDFKRGQDMAARLNKSRGFAVAT